MFKGFDYSSLELIVEKDFLIKLDFDFGRYPRLQVTHYIGNKIVNILVLQGGSGADA